MKFKQIITGLSFLVLSALSIQAQAERREGGGEFYMFSPYLYGQDYQFEGGGSASTKSHAGFGVGLGYNFSDNLTVTGDISWNSFNYDGTRIIDDGSRTVETFRGGMDTWDLRLGGDYYFGTGKLAPFVNANFGWSFIDTNVPNAPPGAACWWDPWWGYICSGYQSTHTENALFYGAGIGLRLELGRQNFVKVGYYNEWTDYDVSSGSPSLDMLRLEFGWAF